MKRIDTADRDQDLFGAGKDGFTDGDPGMGIPPTHLDDSWFNNIQEELANLIESNGITLDGATLTQLLSAFRTPVGVGTAAAIAATGGSTSGTGLTGTGGVTNGKGVAGFGAGTGCGVEGSGASSPIATAATTGSGLVGRGGQTNGFGVEAFGKGAGAGVKGTGQTAAPGVKGQGGTTGAGVEGTGGATAGASGVTGTGGAGGGQGVIGTGTGAYAGATFTGGTNQTGVIGVGGATNSDGVHGQATGTGDAVSGTAASSTSSRAIYGVHVTAGGIAVKGNNQASGDGAGAGVHGVAVGNYGVIAEADTSSPHRAALRIVPQDTEPGTGVMGDHFVQDDSGLPSIYDGNEWAGLVAKPYAGTNASDSVTAQDTFAQLFTIKADTLRIGSVIRMWAAGVCTDGGHGTGRVNVGLLGTAFCNSKSRTPVTNDAFIFFIEATITALGGSGKAHIHGFCHYGKTGESGAIGTDLWTTIDQKVQTFDTTVDHDCQVSSLDTSMNVFRLDELVVEVSN